MLMLIQLRLSCRFLVQNVGTGLLGIPNATRIFAIPTECGSSWCCRCQHFLHRRAGRQENRQVHHQEQARIDGQWPVECIGRGNEFDDEERHLMEDP